MKILLFHLFDPLQKPRGFRALVASSGAVILRVAMERWHGARAPFVINARCQIALRVAALIIQRRDEMGKRILVDRIVFLNRLGFSQRWP